MNSTIYQQVQEIKTSCIINSIKAKKTNLINRLVKNDFPVPRKMSKNSKSLTASTNCSVSDDTDLANTNNVYQGLLIKQMNVQIYPQDQQKISTNKLDIKTWSNIFNAAAKSNPTEVYRSRRREATKPSIPL